MSEDLRQMRVAARERKVVRPFTPESLKEARKELNQIILSALRLADLDWSENELKLLNSIRHPAEELEQDVQDKITLKKDAALKDLFRIREDYGEDLLAMDWEEVPGVVEDLEVLATLMEKADA